MERKQLLPPEHDEYLERIGLTETDRKVYIAALDSGLVTFGEIQQLIKIDDLSIVVDSIRDLIDIGLLKKAEGRMPRYYAILPFMRETITIEKEFTLALDSMIQAIYANKEAIVERRKEITSEDFPNLIKDLLDTYYNKILSPTLGNFENLIETIDSKTGENKEEIHKFNSSILEELSLMIEPFSNLSETTTSMLMGLIDKIKVSFNNYINENKTENEKILNLGFGKIKEHLDDLNQQSVDFGKNAIEDFNEIDVLSNSFTNLNREVDNLRSQSISELEIRNNSIEQLNASIKSAHTSLLKKLDIEGSSISKSDLNTSFDNITQLVFQLKTDEEEIKNNFDESSKILTSASQLSEKLFQDLLLGNTNRAANFRKDVTKLGEAISTILKSLNTSQGTGIENLQKSMLEIQTSEIEKIEQKIKSIKEQVHEHQVKLEKNFKFITSKLEHHMVELFTKPAEIISPVIDNWVERVKPEIDKFDQDADSKLHELIAIINKFENETIATIIERIRFVKVMVETRSSDLSSIIDFARQFDYTRSSDTWVVVGLPSVSASITDMILRTKSKITIVIPNLDFELLETLRKIRSSISITFVTDLDIARDARIIKRLTESGRTTLRSYEGRDLYACMRDSEEIIFGYIKTDEEMVGIRSSTPSIVELLQDRLNETVIRASKLIS